MKTLPFCLLTLCGCLAGVTAQAQFFTADTTIAAGDTNYDGDDIVVLGCTLTVDGSHAFSDMLLVDGAVLTQSPSTNGISIGGSTGLYLSVQNNVVIDETSAIHADGLNMGSLGMGYGSNANSLPIAYVSGGGAGHAGIGGKSYAGALGGQAYGNAMTIAAGEMGSSGGHGGNGLGGAGGGYISLTVGGAILVDGAITASGANGTNSASGGGSGGSISLTADSIVGAGSISANGGDGEGFDGGGGGGGRVVLNCQTNGLTGPITAYGGQGNVGGGAGTVFIAVSNSVPLLVLDNNGVDGTNTPLTSLSVAPDLTITNGAVAEAPPGPTNLFSLKSLVIGPNSGFEPASGADNLNLLVSGNALVASNAAIFADGVSTGVTDAGASVTELNLTTGGGGGNGGFGGLGATAAAGGSSLAVLGPIPPLGSVGGNGGHGVLNQGEDPGGEGGGLINLNVLGTLTLDGTLSANGADGVALGNGGGAGGSVAIEAAIVSGTGNISANGGAGEGMLGGGGGGGRVIIYSLGNQFTGSMTAYGGTGFRAGGAGTILQSPAITSLTGVLTIDAGGIVGTNTPLPSFDSRYGVILLNGARVVISGQTFTLTNLFVGSNCVLQPMLSYLATANINASPGGVTVAAGGSISWDGAGIFGSGQGPGGQTLAVSNVITGGGGAGVGDGGNSAFGAAGGYFQGEILQAEPPGAGGAGVLFQRGGAPGGSLEITTQGAMVIDGSISANGAPGIPQGSGGGGGGNITINAQYLTGTGIISANGGSGNLPSGGGGGGGHIIALYRSNQFNGTFAAYGGAGANYGGAGVVLLEPNENQEPDQVILNNNGHRGTNTFLNGLPYQANLVISNGAIASVEAELSMENLFIGSNSFIVSAQLQDRGVSLMVTGAATIQQGGGISLDGIMVPGLQSLGAGTSALYKLGGFEAGSGASHGGYGGTSVSGAPSGQTYDFFTQPEQPGGPGGSGAGQILGGGAGGGFVVISVNGLLTLNGVISANGTQGTNPASGGGSGGSISLRASGLAGSGNLSVNGGSGNLPFGGGGAGGLISLSLRSNMFTGAISARGGPGYVAGGAGIIYSAPYTSFPPVVPPKPTYALLIDNGGLSGTNTPLATTIDNGIAVGSYNLQVSGGAIVQPAKGATGIIVNTLLVESNGVITQAPGQGLLSITALSNATVGWGGSISVNGQGYNGGSGPGAGGWAKSGAGGGGGNGGRGGNGAFGALGGATNGSVTWPEELGSGGGALVSNSPYSQGGGAVQLSARGNLILAGMVSANGFSSRYPGAGGGSGGSVTISAQTLSGNGVISVNGGPGDPDLGGGGGGGRVAVLSPSNTFAGTISILGGTGFDAGEMGTLFTSTNLSPAQPNLIESPRISAELNSSAGALTLHWTGSSAATYQVYYSTNLIDWAPYGSPLYGSDAPMSFSASCDGASKFFRVVSGN